MSTWVNCTTTDNGYMGAISFGVSDTNECNWLGIMNTNHWGGGLFGNNINTSILVNTGEWKYLTQTYDGSAINGATKIYLNEVFVVSNNRSPDIQVGKTLIGGIGTSTVNYFFGPGKIAAAQIYNRELTQPEIIQNYNNTKARFGL